MKEEKKMKLAGVLIFLLLLMLLFSAFFSQRFYLKKVEIYGNERLKEEEIKNVLQVKGGEHLLFLNGERVRRNLMKIAWVEDARVIKEIPSRLKIEVRERTPLFIYQNMGNFTLVDSNGIPFIKGRDENLPLVSLNSLNDLTLATYLISLMKENNFDILQLSLRDDGVEFEIAWKGEKLKVFFPHYLSDIKKGIRFLRALLEYCERKNMYARKITLLKKKGILEIRR